MADSLCCAEVCETMDNVLKQASFYQPGSTSQCTVSPEQSEQPPQQVCHHYGHHQIAGSTSSGLAEKNNNNNNNRSTYLDPVSGAAAVTDSLSVHWNWSDKRAHSCQELSRLAEMASDSPADKGDAAAATSLLPASAGGDPAPAPNGELDFGADELPMPVFSTKKRVSAPSILIHQSSLLEIQLSCCCRGGACRTGWDCPGMGPGPEAEAERKAWLMAPPSPWESSDLNEDDGSDWEAPVDVDLEEEPCSETAKRSRKVTWTAVRALTSLLPNRKVRRPWTQMAGHAGSFRAGPRGTVLKLLVAKEERNLCLIMLDLDLRPHVPRYYGNVTRDGNCYVQLQDLLCEFSSPCVMDVKMGVRTYLEEELRKASKKPAPRRDSLAKAVSRLLDSRNKEEDLYQKMVSIDPEAPTETEREQGAVLKARYMKFRDDMSSTSTLGFRIEGIKTQQEASKDFKNTRTLDEVSTALQGFIGSNTAALEKYNSLLADISQAVQLSSFCQSHEMVGTSLLFVHDDSGMAGVWLIDFAKCCRLPTDVATNHRSSWEAGNFEDGYLFGLDNLQGVFRALVGQLL